MIYNNKAIEADPFREILYNGTTAAAMPPPVIDLSAPMPMRVRSGYLQ